MRCDTCLVNISYVPQFVVEIASFVIIAFVLEIILSTLYLIRMKFSGRDKKDNRTESEQPV